MPEVEDRYLGPIKTAVAAAAGTGIPAGFVPALDTGGIGTIWSTMIGGIAARAGREIGAPDLARLVATAVSAVSGYVLGSKILSWLAAPLAIAFPVDGVPAAVAVRAMLNGIFTLRLGTACAQHFTDPGFTGLDIANLTAGISARLTRLPNGDEIKTIKDMLTAHGPETEATSIPGGQ
jgi:hypothetical protein